MKKLLALLVALVPSIAYADLSRSLVFKSGVVSQVGDSTTLVVGNGIATSYGNLSLFPQSGVVAVTGSVTITGTANFANGVLSGDGVNVSQLATAIANALPALIGQQYAVLMESPIGTKSWGRLSVDQILPAYAVTGFSSGQVTNKELGDTIVNPSFTISYNRTAAAATITDSDGNTPSVLFSPFTSGSMHFTYSKSSPNAGETWTVTANESGGPSKTASIGATWFTRTWYGIATPATITSSFITSLPSTNLASGFAGSFAIGAGNNTMKAYYCIDASFGTPNSFKDGNGFSVPMTALSAVNVTNAFSVMRSIVCYVSSNYLNAAFTLVVQ